MHDLNGLATMLKPVERIFQQDKNGKLFAIPGQFLLKKIPFVGCSETPSGIELADFDKSDPGIFARMITRYSLSIDYNTKKKNLAATAAKASTARYEECISKLPDAEKNFISSAYAQGSKSYIPKPKAKSGSSTITGVEEDREKNKAKRIREQ